MSASKVLYTGDGVVTSFNIPFPYISTSHLKVFVDTILQLNPMNYTLSGASTILFGSAPGDLSAVEIRRNTSPTDTLVDFQDGSVLSESDLDTAYLHNFYLGQEYADSFNDLINSVLLKIASDTGIVETETDLIIAALVNEMLLDANAANLQARITDIDGNAEAIITLGEGLQTQINTLAQGIAATVYIQDEAPVPGVAGVPDPIPDGARWYDSNDNNHPYIYQNDAWADLEDPRIGVNAADITVLEVSLATAEGDIIGNAGIVSVLDTTVTANETANATAHTSFSADIGVNSADIVTEQTARATADTAIASDVTALTASVQTDITAAVLTESQARVSADDALAAVTAALVVTMGTDIAAAVLTETTARVTADAAETTARQDQYVTVGNDIAAAVLTETNARVTADSAEASDRVALGVTLSADMVAAVLVETNVRITEDAAVAATVTALTSQMATDIAAAVLTETNARTTADTALAAVTTTLQTEVDDNLATIVTHATSIDGIETEYGVDLTVNGYVQGFRIINGGTGGENAFVIAADRFAIVDPSVDPGETEYVPFEIANGKINMRGDVTIHGDLMVTGTINGSAIVPGGIGSTEIGPNAIFSTHIGADQIVANHILAGEITATHMTITNLAAITAQMGVLTIDDELTFASGGKLTMSSNGHMKGGQTAYHTGSGFFLGYESGQYKFSIGNPATGNYMTWDGTTMTIKGDLVVGLYEQSDNIILSATIERNTMGGDAGGDVWVQKKGFTIAKDGDIRIVVDYKTAGFSGGVNRESKWRVKVGGSVKSTWTSSTQTAYTTRTVNVSNVNAGNSVTIEISGGSQNTQEPQGVQVWCKNAYVKADVVLTAGGSVTQD